MTGVEMPVGYVCACVVGKGRRVAGRADAEVGRGLDAGMDRVHDLVGLVRRKLDQLVEGLRGREPAAEAGAGDQVDFRHSTLHGPVAGQGTAHDQGGRSS